MWLINELPIFMMRAVLNGTRRFFHARFKSTLQYGQYKVTPARGVPVAIARPGYVGNPNYPRRNLVTDPIQIHSPEKLQKIAEASKIVAQAVKNAISSAREDVTTDHLDEIVHNTIVQAKAYPSPIDYYGFPKSVCTSVNETLVHGIPDHRPLKGGDYLNVDVTCFYEGVHGDSSAMAVVGEVDPAVSKLVKRSEK
eukprot:TRINITY_DN5177_c0_g1_i12.p1 TRINITY_DN5177_c0_g1~~TRINITY_DN5177_c0_g1_i12.p1  ORF type:complete len:196 (+),score=48.75 TRINITY_DN5177_c0_g1_i12:113-700(+)